VECLKPLSTAALAHYLQRLNTAWPEGYRTEVNLLAVDWMEQVGRRMDRGFVLTVDYGHTAQDLYGSDRKDGTSSAISGSRPNDDPFVSVGEQDMTAHVDFSSLASVGETQGLHVTGFTNQRVFWMGLGAEEMIGYWSQRPCVSRRVHLLKPNGMGSIFRCSFNTRESSPAIGRLEDLSPSSVRLLAGCSAPDICKDNTMALYGSDRASRSPHG